MSQLKPKKKKNSATFYAAKIVCRFTACRPESTDLQLLTGILKKICRGQTLGCRPPFSSAKN